MRVSMHPSAFIAAAEVNLLVQVQLTRIVVVLSVFAIGAELPAGYVKKHWKGLALLLGPK